MGPQIQWVHSYVAGDKIYCIYKAENEELIREHAKKGRIPRKQDYWKSFCYQPRNRKDVK